MASKLTALEFTQHWVETTWREDFSYGVITYDPRLYDPDQHQDLPNAVAKAKIERERDEDERFRQVVSQVIDGLRSLRIDLRDARRLLAREGRSERVWLVTTKEGLIAAIAEVFQLGGNSWDNPGRHAWCEGGIFHVNFWQER